MHFAWNYSSFLCSFVLIRKEKVFFFLSNLIFAKYITNIIAKKGNTKRRFDPCLVLHRISKISKKPPIIAKMIS